MKYLFPTLLLIVSTHFSVYAQTGSAQEPVRFVGGQTVDPSLHEGRLRYAIGTENRQTMRANRTHPEYADGQGWTYNHASNICYWNGTFFQHYLSNPVDEHVAPGQTLVLTSKDGRNWNKPQVVFPPYQAPPDVKIPDGYKGYMMHQRMGFYVAPNGRLLVLGFYGHTENPFRKGGIGRVVREVYKDGTFGPIYFIRYTTDAPWNESNTSYPFYKKSTDTDFVASCEALLKDQLMTFQWYEEDGGTDGFHNNKKGASALSYYHRKDGKVVALWKKSMTAISSDEGKTFSEPVKVPTFLMSGGKQWGQKTEDGRYAISYNPIEQTQYRFPLVVVTGEDGIIYDNMLLVQGELPPRRFSGRWKDFGPCYMRGIEEGNGNPPGTDMWLSYSMNKEDIWIGRVPVPIKYAVKGTVSDNFDQLAIGGIIPDWNIYAPAWATPSVIKSPEKTGNAIQLFDKDPCDYARAIRVFEEGKNVSTSFKIYADPANTGRLEIDLTDQFGNRPVRISFDEKGNILATDGSKEKILQPYQKAKWYTLEIRTEANLTGQYSLAIDGKKVLEKAQLAEAVKSIERLSLRTGTYRNLPNRLTPNETNDPPLTGADEPVDPTIFYIDDVVIKSL
ncbi:hypothetical protein ACFP1I_06090 [Dyadobacter subterraneus]|uniref:BNR repeat-like domain-containing protein n=1 Tax=Dyadobacter subterraneus TaxID=2773304 RepID=A0ABR9WFM5_9BACT|nr:hypothetical protein [Dyadobacter subterraneus]MBE9464302.1 hypothetical protein [Dyadobacter subterraneus]